MYLAEHHRLADGASLKADPAANRRGYPLWSRPTISALNEKPEFSASAKEMCTVNRNRSAAEVAYGSFSTEMGCPHDVRFAPVSDH